MNEPFGLHVRRCAHCRRNRLADAIGTLAAGALFLGVAWLFLVFVLSR